jgi:DNA-binding NarL/FixJ family response regulator
MHTLLLADDHCSMRAALRRIIESDSRFSLVGEAANLGEALARSERLRPALLLLDLHMPDQKAYKPASVKTQLKSSCGCVLAMSIWCDPDSEQLARSYGALRLIDKSNLGTELERWLVSPGAPRA